MSSAQLSPIEDPTKRLEFAGFSILPPRGPGWLSGSVSTLPVSENGIVYRAVFFRATADSAPRTTGGSPRIVALVMVRDLGEVRFRNATDFAESMKSPGGRTRQRHHVLSARAAAVPRSDATCAVYDYALEETGMILLARGLRCLHPQWPSYAVDLAYNQRYPAGREPIDLDAEMAPFLGSLRFTAERP